MKTTYERKVRGSSADRLGITPRADASNAVHQSHINSQPTYSFQYFTVSHSLTQHLCFNIPSFSLDKECVFFGVFITVVN